MELLTAGLKIIRNEMILIFKIFFLFNLFLGSLFSQKLQNKHFNYNKENKKTLLSLKIKKIKKYILLKKEPDVIFDNNFSQVKLSSFSHVMEKRNKNISNKLNQAKIYKNRSQTFFWIGFGAFVSSLFLNRTAYSGAAHAILGISWTVWLGNSALEQAQYNDVKDLYNINLK